MPIAVISADRIQDWDDFHDLFAETLGFPSYYGRNMAAWIDCMTYVDDPDAGMVASGVLVDDGDVLTLQIDGVHSLIERRPDIFKALANCAAFVNWRRIEMGERPILALAYFDRPTD